MCGYTNGSSSSNELSKVVSGGVVAAETSSPKTGDVVAGKTNRNYNRYMHGTLVSVTNDLAEVDIIGSRRMTLWADTLKVLPDDQSFLDSNETITKIGDLVRGDGDKFGVLQSVVADTYQEVMTAKISDRYENEHQINMHEITRVAGIGDRVTGNTQQNLTGDSYTGTIKRFDSFGTTALTLDGGSEYNVWSSTLTPVVAETTPEAPVALETPPSAPDVAKPTYPVDGSVDYNKTVLADNRHTVKVLAFYETQEYPFLIEVSDDGEIAIEQADEDGNTRSGNYEIENTKELPTQVWVRLLTDEDGDIFTSEETFETRGLAKRASLNYGQRLLNIIAASTTAEEDEDLDDSEPEGVQTQSVYISTGTVSLNVGDKLYASRKGFGRRIVTIKRFRADPTKSVEVQADDGTGAYWALNKNLSRT